MAQFRPKRRRTTSQPVTASVAGGKQVSVDAAAVRDLSKSRRTGIVAARTPRDQLNEIGYDAVRKAATDAGRKPPSARTFRRWRQQNRIPDVNVAKLVARRDEIKRLGGTADAAQQLGRSERAVRDYQAGRTRNLRPDARSRLVDAKAAQRLIDSGIDTSTATPTIRFYADVHARDSGEGYDYRSRKEFSFGGSDPKDHTPMSHDQITALGRALADDDYARATALLEEHASTNFALFDDYDDTFGFHFDRISDFRIDWD